MHAGLCLFVFPSVRLCLFICSSVSVDLSIYLSDSLPLPLPLSLSNQGHLLSRLLSVSLVFALSLSLSLSLSLGISVSFCLSLSSNQGLVPREDIVATARIYLAQCINQLFLEGQLSHKIVDLLLRLVAVNNKLTILCGS